MTDVLSGVLHAVRLRGAVFFVIDAGAPWAAEADPAETIAGRVFPGADRVIEYHVVTRGACWGGVAGGRMHRLSEGDVIAFPRGDPHVLASAPELRAAPNEIPEPPHPSLPFHLRQGGGGEAIQVVCGFLGCDAVPFNPLLGALPPVLIAHTRGDARLEALLQMALAESAAPREGGKRILSGLSEVMFAEVVRQYLAALGGGETGWLAGLRDEVVGPALAHLHERPSAPWTLEDLARAAGASRSVLAERFTQRVGIPPMQYLAQWRMQLAAALLARGEANVAAVASEVGYESEAAFSRAFKRLVGVPPGAWRRRRSPEAKAS